jgi:hypothetical protein
MFSPSQGQPFGHAAEQTENERGKDDFARRVEYMCQKGDQPDRADQLKRY